MCKSISCVSLISELFSVIILHTCDLALLCFSRFRKYLDNFLQTRTNLIWNALLCLLLYNYGVSRSGFEVIVLSNYLLSQPVFMFHTSQFPLPRLFKGNFPRKIITFSSINYLFNTLDLLPHSEWYKGSIL